MTRRAFGNGHGKRAGSRLAIAMELAFAASAAMCGGAALAQAADGAAAAPGEPAAAETLPSVTVTDHRGAVDEAPPPAPGGQVGSGARMGILGNAPVMNTPFSVTSYTTEAIENDQARSVADVVAMDPSVRMASARSNINEDIIIRGFQVPSGDFALNGCSA